MTEPIITDDRIDGNESSSEDEDLLIEIIQRRVTHQQESPAVDEAETQDEQAAAEQSAESTTNQDAETAESGEPNEDGGVE